MDNQQIKDALLAANVALVDRIGHQPYLEIKLTLDGDSWAAGGAYLDSHMRDRFSGPSAGTPEEALEGVMLAIQKMPSAAERNLSEFQKKVADAIDFGNEHGIDVQWVNPLIEMSRSLASNALPAPGDR